MRKARIGLTVSEARLARKNFFFFYSVEWWSVFPLLTTPLADLDFLPAPFRRAARAEGMETVGELLCWFPFRFEDRTAFSSGGEATESPVCLKARVESMALRRFGRRKSMFTLRLARENEAATALLEARWFNIPYLEKAFTKGQEVLFFGKIKETKGVLHMDHPEWEPVEPGEEAIHSLRLTPVYRQKGALRQRSIRKSIHRLLSLLEPAAVPDLLRSPSPGGEFRGMNRHLAFQAVHFPESTGQHQLAERYLALEEFHQLQMTLLQRKTARRLAKGPVCRPDKKGLQRFLTSLPFSLTNGQRQCLDDILSDMASPSPMYRLLQGDVGSGKTVVAMAAMVQTANAGLLSVLMAPTQLLAEQHFLLFQRLLTPLGLRVGLKTAHTRKDISPAGTETNPDGTDIWIGTHALLFEDRPLPRLGLVVIDEQHRFGVSQRARLLARGENPHVLVMTATPIPRTLAFTLYGDLDFSLLTERPAGTGRRTTRLLPAWTNPSVAAIIREHLENGRQAFLVCPLVEKSDKLEAAAATEVWSQWREWLAPWETALVTGRTPAAKKNVIMDSFRKGGLHALVATQVIEVGVDIPNASLMVIFHAERFGLAQLHQLRGRVGRGTEDSLCLLCPGKGGGRKDATGRLDILTQTEDGFLIAEEDLRRRGPGELLGKDQSGLPPLKFAHLSGDLRLWKTARQLASESMSGQTGGIRARAEADIMG